MSLIDGDIDYRFQEDITVLKLLKYIDGTYDQHYAQAKTQTTEIAFEQGHGEGFCMGNIIKYTQRFGKKKGKNTVDLYKIIHYAIILLGHMDKESNEALETELREYQEQMAVDQD